MLGSRAIAPTWDDNAAGMAEAFSYKAAADGPVDVVNVYLDRHWNPGKVGRPGARLIAGIYADANDRPGKLLGTGDLRTFKYRAWNTVSISPVELEKGKRYWIAMLGLRDDFVFRTHAGGKGTSPSVTSPKGQQELAATWKTDRVFPKDSPASIYAAERYSVLVFTKNATGNVAEGVDALRRLADAQEVAFDVTDDASKFTEANLGKYRVVVFLNNAGDVLDDAQQRAFEMFFRGGGGFLGIHSAIEAEPDWQFMTDVLGTRATGRTDPTTATVKVADRVHLASKGLPEYWTRTDRWYNFTGNVRGLSHVLATVDESTYAGGANGHDHPIAWCKDYRGGRSFYTGGGGTAESFESASFRRHLAGALDWAAAKADPVYSDCGATVLANYQMDFVAAPPNVSEPIGFDVLPDGRVIQTDRRGGVRLHDTETNTTTLLATIPSYTTGEDGMYGGAVDHDFATNKWIYLYYSPAVMDPAYGVDGVTPSGNAPSTGPSPATWDVWKGYNQLSRFKFVEATATEPAHLDLASEQKILKVETNRGGGAHVAGDIDFDSDGNLWIVTGDDTNPQGDGSGGYGPLSDRILSEIQTLAVANATGGTLTLTFEGQTTAPIAFPLVNASIEAALEALPNIDDVAVTGINTRSIQFRGSLAETDVPQMTADGRELTSSSTATVTTATPTIGGWFLQPDIDGRRSALNTNDLRGKILRVKVHDDGSYSIPEGNLFEPGTPKTRPEIYAMGFRNPFRITLDKNDVAYVTDYSPDARAPQNFRGPSGTGRVEIVRKPSNYGWPACYKTDLPYYRWNFLTQAPLDDPPRPYECDDPNHGPENTSRWNTGLTVTPPITNPDIWYSYNDNATPNPLGTPCLAQYDGSGGTCPQLFPELGVGGVGPHGAAPYNYDPDNPNPTKFPPYFDGAFILGEFTRDYLREVRLDSQGRIFKIHNTLNCGASVAPDRPFLCDNPMDMKFGDDGNFYLLTYGDGFFNINPDAAMERFSYVKGARAPQAVIGATPTSGQAPLTVAFSSEGSRDPDPGDAVRFEWDLDGNGTVDSTDPNPSYTYTTTGVYTARLTVVDSNGKSASANTTITVGNTAPVIDVTVPLAGGTFAFGDGIPFSVTVSDAEDGPIDCSRVKVTFVLGHDEHGHAMADTTGCSGILPTNAEDAAHGGNVFGIVDASYTDNAQGAVPALTTVDQNAIRQKRQEVEHVVEQSGTNTAVSADVGGGLQRGSLGNGDWARLNGPFNLVNIDSVTFRTSGGTPGGNAGIVEIRRDAVDGPLLTQVTIAGTANATTYASQTFPLADPGGAHQLYLVFRPAPGGPGNNFFNLNWLEFNGQGISAP